jgi:proteasome lid subunit RPN8/RPN11
VSAGSNVRVVLNPSVAEAIRAHAAATYPHECCGALIADATAIVEAFALPNSTAEGARRRFLVGPSDYRASEAHARERAGALAGFYHSHPDHPARPSPNDLEHAWPNLTYLIVSVNAGTPGELTAWHLREDRTAFTEGEIA